MKSTAVTTKAWQGADKPFGANYGKLMMWFFIISDALTFTGFLVSYGFFRFKFSDAWPIADEVFTHFPFLHGDKPMYYVALMTFVLIFSSVTMVLAVDAGHRLQKTKVAAFMLLTILGGMVFLGSQAWEWSHFIKGEFGAVETRGGQLLQFVDIKTGERVHLSDFCRSQSERKALGRRDAFWFSKESGLPPYSVAEVKAGFERHPNVTVRSQRMDKDGKKIVLSREESKRLLKESTHVIKGANLERNEYGNRLFADFFFFITGFHGFHVFSGVVFNIIIFLNVALGTYEKRKHYEMVEKVGLYWHFVDLVWVFVFTFFYLL